MWQTYENCSDSQMRKFGNDFEKSPLFLVFQQVGVDVCSTVTVFHIYNYNYLSALQSFIRGDISDRRDTSDSPEKQPTNQEQNPKQWQWNEKLSWRQTLKRVSA